MRTALTAVFATPAILSLSIQHPIADAAQPTSAKLEQAAIEKKTAAIALFSSAGLEMREGTRAAIIAGFVCGYSLAGC